MRIVANATGGPAHVVLPFQTRAVCDTDVAGFEVADGQQLPCVSCHFRMDWLNEMLALREVPPR